VYLGTHGRAKYRSDTTIEMTNDDADHARWLQLTHQFDSVSSYGAINDFVPEKFFADKHWFEQYDPSHEYAHGEFDHDYGHGLLRYHLTCKDIEGKYFIVAEEVFSSEELESLFEFCPCQVCDNSWRDIYRYFVCTHCVGCVGSSNAWGSHVHAARERKRVGFVRNTNSLPTLYITGLVILLLALVWQLLM